MFKFLTRLLQSIAIVCAVFLVTDCSQKSPNELGKNAAGIKGADDLAPTLSSIYANILSVNCQSCHNPVNAATSGGGSNLDFTDVGTSFKTLHGAVSGVSSPDCHGLKIVVGGSPATSYLMAVLSGNYSSSNFAGQTNCTPYAVHQTDQNLSANELEAINSWIASGANNN